MRKKRALVIVLALAIVAMVGPRPRVEPVEATRDAELRARVPDRVEALDEALGESERARGPKLDTEKKIVWATGRPAKAPLALVYIHGFSASRRESRR